MVKNILEQILEGSMEPTDLPLELLREITDGFSTNRIIGEGGFSTVYKGIVGNRKVAVKRIKSSMTIDDKLFRREVDSLMEVKHQNVARFLGLCSHTIETPMKIPESRGYIYVETRERLLCFDYSSNGSHDKKITDELRGLEWDKRYKIIKGICTGLHYLHMDKHILHMDLKPANILLDNDMLPMITDFGLSRPTENSHTMSTNIFCSLGYCAPENRFGRGRMSVQSDIYSLGIIIVELVTGDKGVPDTNDNILRRWRHRWNKLEKETSLKYHDQVTNCIEIGSLCQMVDPLERPSISEIMRKFLALESMDNSRTIAHQSTVGQIKPPHWEDDMLGVEPLELQFANSGNDKEPLLSCSVELSNDTNSLIAFKIQKTSPLPYSVEPKTGIVKPGSKCTVDITLPAADTQHHYSKQYTKEFIVRSIQLNEDLTTNDKNEDGFDKHFTGQHVDEIYLSVISEEPYIEEVTDSPTEQAKQYTSSEARPTAIKPESVRLVIKNSTVAPLSKCNKKVMLELTGGDYTSDRPGLDLVALLDVGYCMKGEKMEQLKTAMLFLVGKLSPIDRLSVITFWDNVKTVRTLRHMTEGLRRELQDLISKLEPTSYYGSYPDIHNALQIGVGHLASRKVGVGRVAAIMLVSGDRNSYGDDPSSVFLGDVPLYTFGFSCTQNDPPALLAQLAANSFGGTCSHVLYQDTGGLTMALSQCLAGLLSVAVQNLELTVAPARIGQSTIVKVSAGSYPQEQRKDGSVTVRFGNLYSTEVRKVTVELLLRNTVKGDGTLDILDVIYSHDGPGTMKLSAATVTVTVRRSNEFSEEPAELLAEEARLEMAQMIEVAISMADRYNLDGARNKLVEAQNMPGQQSNSSLRTELQEILELFKTQETYQKLGRRYALSSVSCHNRQRSAGRGGNIEVMRLFATPRMDMYREQANKFLNEPTMLPSSVDDDVNEFGALTVNLASREEEIRRLALDGAPADPELPGDFYVGRPGGYVFSPPPPIGKNSRSSGGLFGLFRKKKSGNN